MSDGLSFGLKLPNCGGILCPPEWATAESLVSLAGVAERCGYESVWFQDHLVPPSELRDIGELRFYEPLMTAASLAPRFPSLRFGIATIILPLREPVLLAKQIAVFESFFPGRLTVGFGTGRYESEFDSFGASWADRGKTADDYLDIVTSLLSGEEVTRDGARTLASASIAPRVTDVRDVLWVGGTANAVLRRTVRYAGGWICAAITPDEVRGYVARLRQIARDEGREAGELRVALSTTVRRAVEGGEPDHSIHRHSKAIDGTESKIVETLRSHVDAGVTDFLVTFEESAPSAFADAAAWFAATVAPAVRASP